MKDGIFSDSEREALRARYEDIKSKGYKLDLTRGKPGKRQLDLSMGMLSVVSSGEDCYSEAGVDCRNYGVLDGLPETKAIFAELLGVPSDNIIVAGNSSLNLMYDMVTRAMIFGVPGGERPWGEQKGIKFLCPVPGYDRHFSICEAFGIEMIPIRMNEDGPDMDIVEALVKTDERIKGIWCVPKFANPSGITYSREVVERFAALTPRAPDFRIFWDNAYIVHSLYPDDPDPADWNIFDEIKKYGREHENMLYCFASTSKITFPGSGVAILAASGENIEYTKKVMSYQTIGHDKINQMRHVKYFGSAEGIRNHMRLHAELLRPKFEIVCGTLERELGGLGIAKWSNPRGGYFVSLDVMPGCAKRVYELCREAGVALTPAGATFPYGHDPNDSNLRIAPTFPENDELQTAMDVLCLCVKLAAAEK
ncbi:MAG: aminotransferase class I/II-fold pyridoxal phosphate-dependent enzyme [Clostridiales bacterium]|nr:aminotransferase class I/II-fold pyridoxal phosphate-dependent enzyme [Clostridiales bacterium]